MIHKIKFVTLLTSLFTFGLFAQDSVTPTVVEATVEEAVVVEEGPHSWSLSNDFKVPQNSEKVSSGHALTYGYKVSEDYSLTTTLAAGASATSFDKNDWKFNHIYLRTTLGMPTLKTFKNDWKVGHSLRYSLPTGDSAQLAGSYGTLQYRTATGGDLTPWLNLSIRNNFAFQLNRNGYGRIQRKVVKADPTATPPVVASTTYEQKGNTLGGYTFGIVPVITIREGLSLTPIFFTWINAVHPDRGSKAFTFKNGYEWEVELLYTIVEGVNLGVFMGKAVSYDAQLRNAWKYNADDTSYGLRFSYSIL